MSGTAWQVSIISQVPRKQFQAPYKQPIQFIHSSLIASTDRRFKLSQPTETKIERKWHDHSTAYRAPRAHAPRSDTRSNLRTRGASSMSRHNHSDRPHALRVSRRTRHAGKRNVTSASLAPGQNVERGLHHIM